MHQLDDLKIDERGARSSCLAKRGNTLRRVPWPGAPSTSGAEKHCDGLHPTLGNVGVLRSLRQPINTQVFDNRPMLKPGLWPPNKPRPTESHAEMRVYEALSRQLPSGWYAWHSLRIRVPGHADTEADFVIADPSRGVLILEIKGGRIEQRDGLWFSNGVQLKQAPREQANHFMHELLRLLQSKQIIPPPCGVATCFPDTEFSRAPGQTDMAGCVLGVHDLRWLDKALPDAMTCALPEGFRPKGKWLQAIPNLWGETWVPRTDFGLKARVEKEDRLRLDAEQFAVLQGLMENESVLVTGAAGTGKTVLALAMARRLAESGKKVLLLRFTEPLARWLANQAGGENLEVWR
jgi:hypothetical protein